MPSAPPFMAELILRRPTMHLRWLGLSVDDPDAGRRVRTFAALTLAGWGLGGLLDSVQLCASELLGNCVKHARLYGRWQVGVALRAWPAWLVLEVSDDDPRPPVLPTPDVEDDPEALLATRRRGLGIVRELADDVWWQPRESGGKTVLARFATGKRWSR
ncbi:ATP-binding protein [Peterkaempfera bronchialis]|uniref:ATP-binding protein n=1 Tax=Peterkaempfera bronchialis TaxID=2126346 RepID=A0A345T1K7_9ACTN|nr:ATP-binding protein [Peterkaempfera bronchialis]AXI79862.1 ATP-binding protein [Peterkaempfera bronchialis]